MSLLGKIAIVCVAIPRDIYVDTLHCVDARMLTGTVREPVLKSGFRKARDIGESGVGMASHR